MKSELLDFHCGRPDKRRARRGGWRLALALKPAFLLALAIVWPACRCPPGPISARPFHFAEDTLAYPNGLAWEYRFDPAAGKMRTRRRQPSPDYSLHCFAVARSVRQFFQQARFDPDLPKVDRSDYERLVRAVLRRPPRCQELQGQAVVIPGFGNLREFSQAEETLLKKAGGGAWRSYVQRGNWRMIFPFSGGQERREADRLEREISEHQLPLVHVVRFPELTINHVLLVYAVDEGADAIRFRTYDPNEPGGPLELRFDRRAGRFALPATRYFMGGAVDVYEIYRGWLF